MAVYVIYVLVIVLCLIPIILSVYFGVAIGYDFIYIMRCRRYPFIFHDLLLDLMIMIVSVLFSFLCIKMIIFIISKF